MRGRYELGWSGNEKRPLPGAPLSVHQAATRLRDCDAVLLRDDLAEGDLRRVGKH
jgi:hypothetical protein